MTTQTQAPKLLLSRKEVLALLGLSETAFDRRRSEGRMLDPVPGFADNGHPKWSYADVKAWVDAGAPPAAKWRELKATQQGLTASLASAPDTAAAR